MKFLDFKFFVEIKLQLELKQFYQQVNKNNGIQVWKTKYQKIFGDGV